MPHSPPHLMAVELVVMAVELVVRAVVGLKALLSQLGLHRLHLRGDGLQGALVALLPLQGLIQAPLLLTDLETVSSSCSQLHCFTMEHI